MKKYIKTVLALTLSGMLFASCDSYLDVAPKGSEVLTTVDQYAALFNSQGKHLYIFQDDNIKYTVDDIWTSIGSVNEDEPTANLLSKTFLYVPVEQSARFSDYGSSTLYTTCYARISTICNITLDNIGDATGDGALRARTIAEALALRAYNYFILVNLYGRQYDATTATTDLSVPLWLHYDLDQRPKQATVAEVYKQIEDDLTAAIPDLAQEPENSFHFSKAAGYALLAKVYLQKGDFANAETNAKLSYDLNHNVYDLVTALDVTGTPALPKGTQIKENLYFALRSVSGLGGVNSPYYLGPISPELTNMFDQTNDFRFAKFMSFNTTTLGTPTSSNQLTKGDSGLAAAWDDATATRTGAKYYYANVAGLRTTDVILILAECAARKSDYSTMMNYVDEVRKMRIKGYVRPAVSFGSWQNAVDEVVNERRKEFMGCPFYRWCDLRRLTKEFNRTLTRRFPANTSIPTVPQKVYNLPANSDWYVVPLPSTEFQYYPNMKYTTPY